MKVLSGVPKKEQVLALMEAAEGRIIGVRFIKRTDGTIRDMNCRAGVKKYRRGGQLAFDVREKGLYPVFDMTKREYRFVPLEGVLQLRVDGAEYQFNDNGLVAIEGDAPEGAHLAGVRTGSLYSDFDPEAGF